MELFMPNHLPTRNTFPIARRRIRILHELLGGLFIDGFQREVLPTGDDLLDRECLMVRDVQRVDVL